jgi:hypothetical protein
MEQEFSEFGAYQEKGAEVRHYICEDYHLWVWLDGRLEICRFELHYNEWRVKYCDGAFLRGSEEFIMPVFFLIDLKFNCDALIRSKLLRIRDLLDASDAPSAPLEGGNGSRTSAQAYTHGP